MEKGKLYKEWIDSSIIHEENLKKFEAWVAELEFESFWEFAIKQALKDSVPRGNPVKDDTDFEERLNKANILLIK